MPQSDHVAIVGLGCLFPAAPDLATYWRNVVEARDGITEVPPDHSWSPDDLYDADPQAADKSWCTRGGFLDAVPFDPMAFGIPPTMLESIDTTQLLSLLVARETLRDAGRDPDDPTWDRDRVSVILGVTGTQELAVTAGARLQGPVWRKALLRCGVDPALADVVVKDIANHFPAWTEQTFPGLLGNVVAGRIANRLDLGGTNAVVDAACASSLAAVQYAMSDLIAGRSDLVLTGGADTMNDAFMFQCFTRTPAFSRKGDARPFDAEADGILIGEGIALLALKRLADAERDGDRIYAVVRGVGSSSDGRHRSIYAPNPDGQEKALRRTYAMAGVTPDTVELVEAHGTGTRAGDAAEIDALTRVYGAAGRSGRWAALGSVKALIGHTKSTAGAAGLVKAALALHHRVLPPAAKIERPNPKMNFDRSPFYLSPRARPWFGTPAHPRRAAVSAFGFGGSNFHAVLEEHSAADGPGFGAPVAELFLVGAESREELHRQLRALGGPTVAHAARAALADWRPGRSHVAAFLAGSVDEIAERVAIVEGRWAGSAPRPGEPVWTGGGRAPQVAFLFPGQGSQYLEMGRTLALRHPSVRRAFERADEVLGFPLTAKVFPPPAWSDAERKQHEHELQATEIAQPAIGALSLGMARLLARFGVLPSAAAGHSYGELVALCVAGAFDEDTLLRASAARGQLMSASGRDRGGMAAIDGPLEVVERLVDGVPDVVVANRNHPAQAVVSGPAAALAIVLRRAADAGFTGRELRVAAAFHSPLVADAEQPFREALAALPVGRPAFPVIAGALAAHYPDDPDGIRDLLARSLVLPVDWVGTVQALVANGAELLLEVGPRGVLAGLAERCVPDVPVLALDRQADRADGDVQLKATLAALAAAGVPVDPAPLIEQRLPSAPRSASGPATVWLAGANYRKPETRMPPKPVPPPVVPTSSPGDGWGAIPSSGSPMDRPVHLERDVPAPAAAPAAAPASAASGDLLALLESTRATLAAFQEAQAKTADVHARFLDAVHHANDNFARLFEAQTRLVERVAAGGTMPVYAPVPEAVRAAPPPPPPEPVRATARPLPASVALASPDRPAVATDLPPLLDARAAVEARSTPQPMVNEPAILGPGRTPPRHETLVAALLDAVARKTGYPREALELSMDLEADLGVDSIKRVEILSAVREILPELPEIDAEALGGLRTLADVAGHLAGVAAGLGFALIGSEAVGRRQPDLLVPEPAPPRAAVPEPAPPPVLSARDLDPSPPVFLRRSSVCVVPAPEGVPVPPGGRWLVAPDTQGRAARVVDALVARGVDAVVGEPDDGPWSGVVHLGAIGLSGDPLRDAVRGAFELARSVGPVGFFATVSGRGGRFGRAPATGEPLEGALAGLPRTLAREWPGCRALALDIDPDLDAERIADELLRDRGTVDVGRTAHETITLAAVSDAPASAAPDLRPGDLVVVTGGARGVTAACALALVRAVPVSLLLLGRTELADEPAWARGVPEGELLGAAVKAARAAGEPLAPRDADRRAGAIRGAREIRATVRAAERAGAACTYRSVDVRDRAAVAALVAEAVAAHGPVRLVVHGAGVLADRKVVDKTPAQFDEVFSTKVDGLEAVLAACDPAELRSVVAFTSIAGRRGNAGQVDYAMANEAVVQRLLGLPCHVRAIDWGPWAGGMVTPALAAHFASQGLRPIPLAEGAATFVAELGRGGEVEVVVEAPRTASGTEQRVLSAQVPFLRDHRIGGRPVLPAAMVLEWMAELSAEVAPGRHVAAIERFEVLKGITLDAPERAVTVVWEQPSPDALEIEVRSPAVSKGHPVRHYRASVRLSSAPPAQSQWPGPNGLASETYPYAVGEAYDRFLFHGPTLHGIDEIVGWSDHGIVAWLRTSEPRGFGVAGARWETDPLVVDAALQLMCLWVREKLGSAALPSGFGVWRQLAPFSGKRVAAHLSMDAGATTRGGRFDVVFVAEHGAVVAELGRATYTGEPSLVPQFRSGG